MKQLGFINNSTREYVYGLVVGDTYQHRELLKTYKFCFSPVQDTGGPGWNSTPFHKNDLDSQRARLFRDCTKALAEADANVTIYLFDA